MADGSFGVQHYRETARLARKKAQSTWDAFLRAAYTELAVEYERRAAQAEMDDPADT